MQKILKQVQDDRIFQMSQNEKILNIIKMENIRFNNNEKIKKRKERITKDIF